MWAILSLLLGRRVSRVCSQAQTAVPDAAETPANVLGGGAARAVGVSVLRWER